MQVVSPELIKDKKVLLRLDLDVPLRHTQGKLEVEDDFRLQAALPTLELCLAHAKSVVICGHIGRPGGKEVKELSVAPIVDWLEQIYFDLELPEDCLHILENLRFEVGEDMCDPDFAKELAGYGDIFINEAFAAHRQAASTTMVPKLLPSAAGLRFAYEVETLSQIRNNPQKPQVAIIGGAKVDDKYKAVNALSKFADAVLVGGLLAKEIKDKNMEVSSNVVLGKLTEDGLDISGDSIEAFKEVLKHAKQIVWAGPMGKYEVPEGRGGNKALAEAIINTDAHILIGGGDTILALDGFLDFFDFISVGGGAMLKYLTEGTLPTIEALNVPRNNP